MVGRRRWATWATCACLLLVSSLARAQPSSSFDGADALPAMLELPRGAYRPQLAVSIGGAGSYGASIDPLGPRSAHHRASGSLAASVHLVEWLAIALRVDGRYDLVEQPGMRSDDGLSGQPSIVGRATWSSDGGALALGLDVMATMAGGEAPSLAPESTSLRARLFVSGELSLGATTSLVLGASGGLLLDNSRAAAPREITDALTSADRLTLGVSDWSAALMAVGVALHVGHAGEPGELEVLLEWRWRLLVGNGAPDARYAPMHLGAGARAWVVPGWLALSLTVEGRLSADDERLVAAMRGLAPIEPHLTATLGATLRFGELPREATPPPPPPPPPPALGAVSGVVRDVDGAPIEGAVVELQLGDGLLRTTESDALGAFRFDDVPLGSALVTARAEGFVPTRASVDVGTAPQALQVIAERAAPPPPITFAVEGVVVDEAGAPVEGARVRVVGANGEARQTSSDSAGRWRIEGLPGGALTATIEAPRRAAVTLEAVAGAEQSELRAAMGAALPAGELRGTVQSYDGSALAGATVRVDALERTAITDADGAFALEVAPGRHEITIEAEGHRPQTRRATVADAGVVVLNVQLRRAR